MKKNRILSMISAAVLLTAGACSDDTLNQGNAGQGLLDINDNSGGVYMTVDFQLPSGGSGTRSLTIDPDDPNDPEDNDNPNGYVSSDGEEIGSDAENNVSTALIVLASTEDKTVGDVTVEKYGYIVAGEVQTNHIAYLTSGNQDKQYRATAKLNKANLNALYGLYTNETTVDGESVFLANVPEVYVFVFCNPTSELSNMFANADTNEQSLQFGSADWIDKTCTVIQGSLTKPNENIGIWSANSFLMNNKVLTKRDLPKQLLDWENYNSYDNPFHLSEKNKSVNGHDEVDNETNRGAVLVERSVARFDFMDGSKGYNEEQGNTYPVLYLTDKDGNIEENKPIVDVQIQKMCLVNMGNEFYYLPRVSDNGFLTGDNYELCGREKAWTRNPVTGEYTGGNYIVGPRAEIYSNLPGDPAFPSDVFKFSDYLNYPFFEDNGSFNNDAMSSSRWNVVKVEDVLKGSTDTYVNADKNFNKSFRVWRYVVENVIPSPIELQKNAISTGVVFKAKMLGSEVARSSTTFEEEEYWNKGYVNNLANCLDGKPFIYEGTNQTGLTGSSAKDPILYYFSGRIYMGWRHIRQAAIQASVTKNVSGELEINSSNSLYKAVFGEGPIPPVVENEKDAQGNPVKLYYYPSDGSDKIAIDDPLWPHVADKTVYETWNSDPNDTAYKNYLNSANYAWTAWAIGGKEVGSDATGVNTPELLKKMREAVIGSGIAIYQSSMDADYGAGYYCYYYYWNRHNDNSLNGSMGPMEFDVVRNNVYKLYIDKISRIGHPRIPENDPNNPTPNTPDESDDIYLDVKLQIVPWVVRLNSIQF